MPCSGAARLELTAALLDDAAVGALPGLERLGAQRQADRARGARPVRHRRDRWRSRLYSVGAAVYVPHLFNTYATRYGVIGAVFAMISALFCIMVVIVGSAAAGREVHDELDRIRRGERPAEDEVRRQWDEVTGRGAVAVGHAAPADPRASRPRPQRLRARGDRSGQLPGLRRQRSRSATRSSTSCWAPGDSSPGATPLTVMSRARSSSARAGAMASQLETPTIAPP